MITCKYQRARFTSPKLLLAFPSISSFLLPSFALCNHKTDHWLHTLLRGTALKLSQRGGMEQRKRSWRVRSAGSTFPMIPPPSHSRKSWPSPSFHSAAHDCADHSSSRDFAFTTSLPLPSSFARPHYRNCSKLHLFRHFQTQASHSIS